MVSKVLVVDDEPAFESLICRKFRKRIRQGELAFIFAANGNEALEKVRENTDLDLVLTDINMPQMDGLTLLKELNRLNPTFKTIVISAYGDMKNIRKAMNEGAFDFLTKPINLNDLEVTVEKILKDVKKSKELERRLALSQVQLIQSEKMSGLGQMVAGVAHEINNPMSFMSGNIVHAEEYARDLIELVKIFQEECSQPSERLQEKMDEIEFDFLIEDLPKLMQSMKIGSDRIVEIVRSLRCFSRLDEAKFRKVDIRDNIDSTLMILRNRLKAKSDRPEIEIVQDYSELPCIDCYSGQINQVLMNILSNAIDALEDALGMKEERDRFMNQSPKIWIQTQFSQKPDWISIRLKDNGSGIPEENMTKLFDPFFTTKPIGKGTGLGLSISYEIVTEKHGGQLQIFSELGKGTEFAIELPIHQQSEENAIAAVKEEKSAIQELYV
ncbi:MAG: response regulator [Cyanobacteria bacterium SBLK]|nr:response regulator [Cyanobacteria bacterium SBLK]